MEQRLTQLYTDYSATRKQGEYSPATIKTYIKNICNLHCMCNLKHDFKSLEFLRNTEHVLHSLQSKGTQTKRNYINSAIIALKASVNSNPVSPATSWMEPLVVHYENVRDILYHEYILEKENNKGKTSAQTEVFSKVKKEDIDKLCNIIVSTDNFEEYQSNMILNLYKCFPLRNELADVKCITIREYNKSHRDNNKENFLVIRKGGKHFTLVFNNYKTSKKLGKKTIDIKDKRLVNMICTWLKDVRNISLKDINMVPFLCWKNGNPLSRNEMAMKLRTYTNTHLGCNISSTLLAKYYSPEIMDLSNPSIEEIKKVVTFADQRGHTVATHLAHYNQS